MHPRRRGLESLLHRDTHHPGSPLLLSAASPTRCAVSSKFAKNRRSCAIPLRLNCRLGSNPGRAPSQIAVSGDSLTEKAPLQRHVVHRRLGRRGASPVEKLRGRVRINRNIVAECSAENPQFNLDEAIAHMSRGGQLLPGEFFGTGTWPNGSGMENGHWLRPGHTIRLEIDGIGSISNKIGERWPIRSLNMR
jgi:hypothetical protein